MPAGITVLRSCVDALARGARHVDRVLARLLGHGQRHGRGSRCRVGRAGWPAAVRPRGARREPDIARAAAPRPPRRGPPRAGRPACPRARRPPGRRRRRPSAGTRRSRPPACGPALPASSITVPAGMPRLARGQRLLQAQQVDAALAQARSGRSVTCTTRPGPPMVCTSRAPGTRLSSASMACATRSSSRRWLRVAAPQRDRQHRHVVDALGLDDRRQRAQVGAAASPGWR